MIDAISQALSEGGLVKPGVALRYNFLLTKGTCLVAEVTSSTGEAFFVKFSELSDLEEEFGRITTAKQYYHEFVPKQHGFHRQSPLNLIISARLEHSAVTTPIASQRFAPDLYSNIERFFGYSATTLDTQAKNNQHETTLISISDYLGQDLQTRLAGSIDYREILSLPSIPQHGDFVINNFGLSGRNLYVFDWEDYGKITIPGLDLATFIFSASAFRAQKVQDIMHDSAAVNPAFGSLIERCCNQISLDKSMFLRMLPLYLGVFLYLKREYGPHVQTLVRDCLEQLLRQS